MTQTKATKTRKLDQTIIDRLLAQLSQTKEGKALVDFARHRKVKFVREYDQVNTGFWRHRDNTLFLNKALTREEALVSLSHELRHAWQTHSVKNLARATDRNMLKTKFKKAVVMLRAMEADAYSYQLSATIDLCKKGIIRQRPEKAFMTMEETPELRNFVKGFIKKHAHQPFSAAARKESFLFFQTSTLFYHSYDDGIYAGMGANVTRRKLGEEDLDYASIMGFPTLGAVFNTFGQSKISDPKIKYMQTSDRHDVTRFTLQNLHPSVKKIINRTNKRLYDLHRNVERKGYDFKKLERMIKTA